MNVNSTYSIGYTHLVCEDYALASVAPTISYAIVCDGCSSSNDVDFGARCLAMSAKRELRLNPDITAFNGKKAVANAQRVVDVFPYLSPSFLDATLLVAAVDNNTKRACVHMWGDGVMVHRKKDGIIAVHVELTSGAPDYLSYHLDPLRRQAYENMDDNVKEVSIWDGEKMNTKTGDYKPLDPFIYDTQLQDGDIIAVISDGINSFQKADKSYIPWIDLIDEFTLYKTSEGEFALRRINAFKKKCQKDMTTHADDISIAAIIV